MNLPAVLVLCLLCIEMLSFIILVMPATNNMRHKLVVFFETSPIAGQIMHGFRICMIFVSIIFADGIRSILQKHEVSTDLTMNDKIAMGKLIAQRNLYLCGFSLFLAFALWRVEGLLREIDNKVKTTPPAKDVKATTAKAQ